jgi:hypothetical protein
MEIELPDIRKEDLKVDIMKDLKKSEYIFCLYGKRVIPEIV